MKEATKEKNRALLPDEQIIDLYFARDERAIKETDHKYGKYLFTIAYNIVQDTLDCEECLNDTYLDTWNRIPPTRPTVFHAFLSKIMRNIAVDKYRYNTAAKRIPSEMLISLEELDTCTPNEMSMDEELAIAELARLLNDYLKGLGDRERLLFVCRYYYADKISEIAKMLQAGERSVYRELAELREGLRQHLEKEGICCE
ncbi:MAG: sigma-70 family RNA polymerase sigma factor [Clostridia bacterium]|nr:sigma-70 family RNA polymerase sigma factor [Clostridia bacterium]